MQSDGKIVAAGRTYRDATDGDFGLARYNANGSMDTSFGTGGIVYTDFSGGSDSLESIAIQADSKIVAVGFTTSDFTTWQIALARYNTNGTLDSSFGTGGEVITYLPGPVEQAYAVALQADGKILLAAGTYSGSTASDFVVLRYNTNGTPDNTFGTNGYAITDFASQDDFAQSLVVLSDGRILLGGYTGPYPAYNFALARYNANGTLDSSFGTGGKVVSDFNNNTDQIYKVLIDGAGKILAAGSSGTDFALARYNANGTLDSSFGTGGLITTSILGSEVAQDAALTPDGRVTLAGYSAVSGGRADFAIARYGDDTLIPTPTLTPSRTATSSLTRTPTRTRTATPTRTTTPSITSTSGPVTVTRTPTGVTATSTSTSMSTATHTATRTATATPTTVASASSTRTHTLTPTSAPSTTGIPTEIPTGTPTHQPTVTPIRTSTSTVVAASSTPTHVASTATATTGSTITSLPTETETPLGATPTACSIQFTDVPDGSTFYSYIHCLACLGIINGYSDGTFRPNNNVTRGQLSKIVSNSAGFSDPQTVQMFEDVSLGSTYQVFVGRLASRGILGGYPCGTPNEPCMPGNLPYFRPNNNATRGQISKIDSNAAEFNDAPVGQQFQDVAPGSTFYTYTYRLVTRSIMSGYPCGGTGEPCGPANLPYFRPNNNATRGQTSKIVTNTFFPDCNLQPN